MTSSVTRNEFATALRSNVLGATLFCFEDAPRPVGTLPYLGGRPLLTVKARLNFDHPDQVAAIRYQLERAHFEVVAEHRGRPWADATFDLGNSMTSLLVFAPTWNHPHLADSSALLRQVNGIWSECPGVFWAYEAELCEASGPFGDGLAALAAGGCSRFRRAFYGPVADSYPELALGACSPFEEILAMLAHSVAHQSPSDFEWLPNAYIALFAHIAQRDGNPRAQLASHFVSEFAAQRDKLGAVLDDLLSGRL